MEAVGVEEMVGNTATRLVTLLFALYKNSILKKLEGATGFVCHILPLFAKFCNLGFVARWRVE